MTQHWKAYIKVTRPDQSIWQYETTVSAITEYEAVSQFKRRYGDHCIIGWIKQTRLSGLASIGL